ncbi:hypothetical protein ACTXI2_08320 [Glutamicibacter arilaitensis]|uniref:hypothetical protein n=1 Tax=Glutamicibacter arilaitensis TaxID=256701 RepID=UPI003FD56656
MNFRTVLSGILIYSFFVSTGGYASPIITWSTAKCQELDQTELTDTDAEHSYSECKPPKSNNFDEWHTPPKNREKESSDNEPIVQLKFRDFYECHTGDQELNGCDTNPDRPPCPDGSFPITRQVLTLDGDFIRQFSICPGDPMPKDIPKESIIEEPRITLEAFRAFPIEGSTVRSNPVGFSLRHGFSHFWASKNTQVFSSNLSGSKIQIRAIPIQWNWNYGDGTTRNLDFAGEPMPHHTLRDETSTSHSYSDTGTFQVEVTTLYRGEFSVDGGAWQAIPGQAAVPSEPIEIDVWRTEKELIANE